MMESMNDCKRQPGIFAGVGIAKGTLRTFIGEILGRDVETALVPISQLMLPPLNQLLFTFITLIAPKRFVFSSFNISGVVMSLLVKAMVFSG